jgi:hypothetical protein
MLHFEEDEHEPVAVVRTLSDFALALTLVVLMLIGTRTAAGNKTAAAMRAATTQPNTDHSELTVLLEPRGHFTVRSGSTPKQDLTAPALAQQWISTHGNSDATIVLEFPPKTLATDLHRALLELQSAFPTNLARIETLPQP